MPSLKYKGQSLSGGGGQDATVNGVNDLTIVAGENIMLGQDGSTLYIDAFGAVPVLAVTIYPSEGGVSVTATHGATTLTGITDAEGYVEINVPELGTWEVSATIGGELTSDKVLVDGNGTFPVSFYDKTGVYGVQWDGSAATILSRTDDAALFSDPVAATGTGKGSSPFDNIYPWAEMDEYNVIDGKIAYKRGDAGFSRTDYDTVVYIPEFYYQRPDANTFRICGKKIDGFEKHPGSGKYIARYQTTTTNTSSSGGTVNSNVSRAYFRSEAENKGTGWQLLDAQILSAVQMLCLVEFANWYSQDVIGNGIVSSARQNNGATDAMSYHTGQNNVAVQYRGIENVYGNAMVFVDGEIVSSYRLYLCTDPSKYGGTITEDYHDAGVTLPSASDGYVKAVGYSEDYPWAIFPSAVGGSETTYITDAAYISSGTLAVSHGGNNDNGAKGGMFYFMSYLGDTGVHSSRGSRLAFVPTE